MRRRPTIAVLAGALTLVVTVGHAAADPLAAATGQFTRHRYEQAARTLEAALPALEGERRARAELVLGTIYLRNADLHEALARVAALAGLEHLGQLTRTGVEGRSRHARLYLGEALLAHGDVASAARHLQLVHADARADAGDRALAAIGLGSAEWARNDRTRARTLWAEAGGAGEANLARAAAEALAGAGDPGAHARAAETAARARALTARARRYLIEIHLATGAPDKALAVVRAADLSAPSRVETFRAARGTAKSIPFYDLALLTDLARLYRELALRHFGQAATDARIKPSADYYLGEAYAGAHRAESAHKHLQAFVALPNAPAQYRERARVRQALLQYRQGKQAEAESAWTFIAAQERDPEVLADVALACALSGAACTKAVAQLSASAEGGDGRRLRRLNFALGNYYLRKNDPTRALAFLEAGRDKSNKNKLEANDPEMLAALAEGYYRTKKYSEGLEIFFEMSKEFPVVRQIQEAMQGVYSMEQRSAGDVKIF
jgi:hypothetical protein